MNDLTPMFILFMMMNKNGFNNVKNAIEAADNFTSRISSMSNMFSMLPKISGMMNSTQQTNENYVDTLKNISNLFSQ